MSTGGVPNVSEVGPKDAWDILENEKTSMLIDVRTQAEWTFVGSPELASIGKDALRIEWKCFPDMNENPDFLSDLAKQLDESAPSKLLFICRSGARSLSAASAAAQAFADLGRQVTCVNVAEGFEGDLDPQKHRGTLSGWKAVGLPWRQA